MAEVSLIWAAGAGDASPHSLANTALLFGADMGGLSANKGVLIGMLNELLPSSPGAGQVRVATGWAVVDGHPYMNTANVDFTPTTPGIGTTGHRIVLRASWAAQTVRLTDISSADGTAAIPAMTQTPGTTYDVPIMSFTKTTGGVIGALTDTRDWAGPSIFDMIRALYRSPQRRKIAEYCGGGGSLNTDSGVYQPAPLQGLSVYQSGNFLGVEASVLTGEPTALLYGAVGTAGIVPVLGATNVLNACLAPSKSPRMFVRVSPCVSSANTTTWMAGFFSAFSATANGAYLRINTTGNLFFVTRQGGTETTADLGARPTALTSYEIYSDDAGVTWICRNTTTNAIVATHTTNVPTAGTALGYGHYQINAGAVGSSYCAYMRLEATTV